MSKIYFASDFHLGAPDYESSRIREKRIVGWLNSISKDAESIFLVGDIFDFWFDYRTVVPKGYLRLLGKLAELSDSGIKIFLFTGNHDLWLEDYFEKELNITVFKSPQLLSLQGKNIFIGHGDGLGPHDTGYKVLKKYFFISPVFKFLFRWVHPDIGTALASWLSRRSRAAQPLEKFESLENEWLLSYTERKILENPEIDYFIFGHRHLPLDLTLKNGLTRYVNLGEWIYSNTFAVLDNGELELKTHPASTLTKNLL